MMTPEQEPIAQPVPENPYLRLIMFAELYEKVKWLGHANGIHTQDAYEAIILLQQVIGMPESWTQQRDAFLAKMAGPQR